MIATGEAVLSHYDSLFDPAKMGSHHADFHPNGVDIYIGSYEGHVFVVSKDSMEIEKMIETGRGSGHTTFVPKHVYLGEDVNILMGSFIWGGEGDGM
jgi:hypothetical protein